MKTNRTFDVSLTMPYNEVQAIIQVLDKRQKQLDSVEPHLAGFKVAFDAASLLERVKMRLAKQMPSAKELIEQGF